MSFDAWATMRGVRDANDLSSLERLVLVMLIMRCDEHGRCYPSLGRIAKDCDLGRASARRVVKKLAARGLVKITGRTDDAGDQASHLYQLGGWGHSDSTPVHTDSTPAQPDPTVESQGSHGRVSLTPPVGSQGSPKIPNGRSPRKRPTEDRDPEADASVVAVFEHWSSVLWSKVHSKGTPKQTAGRLKHIRARLADGYSAEDLCKVVNAVALSEWHLGANDKQRPYVEPETIFRNAEKVDGWLADKRPTNGKGQSRQPDHGRTGWESRADFQLRRQLEHVAELEAQERAESEALAKVYTVGQTARNEGE
jgi:uncharacterized phage protein (TIGR02220 family)